MRADPSIETLSGESCFGKNERNAGKNPRQIFVEARREKACIFYGRAIERELDVGVCAGTGCCEHERRFADGVTLEIPETVGGQGIEGKFRPSFAHGVCRIRGISRFYGKLERRMFARKSFRERGQDRIACRDRGINAEYAMKAVVPFPKTEFKIISPVDGFPCKEKKCFALRCQRHLSRVPLEQGNSNFFFETGKQAAQGRRAQVYLRSGTGKMKCVCKSQKGFKFVEIHVRNVWCLMHFMQ